MKAKTTSTTAPHFDMLGKWLVRIFDGATSEGLQLILNEIPDITEIQQQAFLTEYAAHKALVSVKSITQVVQDLKSIKLLSEPQIEQLVAGFIAFAEKEIEVSAKEVPIIDAVPGKIFYGIASLMTGPIVNKITQVLQAEGFGGGVTLQVMEANIKADIATCKTAYATSTTMQEVATVYGKSLVTTGLLDLTFPETIDAAADILSDLLGGIVEGELGCIA